MKDLFRNLAALHLHKWLWCHSFPHSHTHTYTQIAASYHARCWCNHREQFKVHFLPQGHFHMWTDGATQPPTLWLVDDLLQSPQYMRDSLPKVFKRCSPKKYFMPGCNSKNCPNILLYCAKLKKYLLLMNNSASFSYIHAVKVSEVKKWNTSVFTLSAPLKMFYSLLALQRIHVTSLAKTCNKQFLAATLFLEAFNFSCGAEWATACCGKNAGENTHHVFLCFTS